MVKTIAAKLENQDRLHEEYPVYKWVTGDKERICFGTYTDDISINRVACINDSGVSLGEGELSSDIEFMSQSGEYIAGLRQLEYGLQSVVLYKIRVVD